MTVILTNVYIAQLHFCARLERCISEEMLKLSYCWTIPGLLEVSSQPAPLSGETDRKNQWGGLQSLQFF